MTLNDTPSAQRLHIGFFGKRNSGKSSLINALASQEVSIVSDIPGTTTDPVSKPMELPGLVACVLTDTAGFDDSDALGELRVGMTAKAAEKTDIAVMVFADADISGELEWIKRFRARNTPVLCAVNKSDEIDADAICALIKEKTELDPVKVSALKKEGVEKLRDELLHLVPEDFGARDLTGGLVKSGDTVLLIMPQDIQAPKGRLILPQVQTIRELLDKKCTVISVAADGVKEALSALKEPPALMITDSQVFAAAYAAKPEKTRLTSFSVLMAAYKGDIAYYTESAAAIDALTASSRVLIAECCSHVPLKEDIGRVKLPKMLRKLKGEGLNIDFVNGTDFPDDLSGYDLVIQCGACMFNRKFVTSRIDRAKAQRVPMTNYGVAIAYINGILDKITY